MKSLKEINAINNGLKPCKTSKVIIEVKKIKEYDERIKQLKTALNIAVKDIESKDKIIIELNKKLSEVKNRLSDCLNMIDLNLITEQDKKNVKKAVK